MHLIKDLEAALIACPFDILGWQQHQGVDLIRAWVPGAQSIAISPLEEHSEQMEMQALGEGGLFELPWPDNKSKFTYRLHITRSDTTFSIIDPYQFKERSFQDFPQDEDHIYQNMGAHLCQAEGVDGQTVNGVRFALYAPNARTVSVVGDFNNWDGRRTPMTSGHDGIWRLFIPALQAGDLYKYELKNQQGHLLPLKSDPVGFYHEQYPSFASVVTDHSSYQWQDQKWQQQPLPTWKEIPICVYEVHVGSWKHNKGQPLSWLELKDQLIPYVVEMGFTHIELLPVMEYPYDGSWGYQPLGLFAPTSRFGSVDDFKTFIDACHQSGIGVIVDWVPAHFPSDAHGLARFDGTPLYEYEDPRRGWHPDWNSYIYDFGRKTVCDFLISSAVAWCDLFHIDGVRVDAVASILYLDYSREEGEWIPNIHGGNHNYEAINFIQRFNTAVYAHFPKAFTVAEESTSFDGVSRPVHNGGLGFGFKWNMGWMHDTLEYMKHEPIHRKYHHNEISFPMVYAYSENYILPLSHDEVVHGKGSIIGKMPGDEWQQTANLRAYYAFMYCHPGKKLNFMGNEIGQVGEWQYQQSLDWHILEFDRHRGIQQLFKDLNHLYRSEPSLYRLDSSPSGFQWLNYGDADASVISFMRFDHERQNPIIVITNFTPVPHERYRLGVPESGSYQLIFNSDAKEYWGSGFDTGIAFKADEIAQDDQQFSIEVRLPPLATIVVRKQP
ncbi:1,4-alpha-glucan branching protein GlgB [Gynuella sp.]|uniref:1,4-alpha-glucan branching protein GlgB n=1 Tax=Gynuella sp. TaxID=2969146 RepID=UPI003D0CA8F8